MNERKIISKGDLILLTTLLLVGGVSFLLWRSHAVGGNQVKIILDGEVVASYPLNEDKEYVVEQEMGTNRVVIRNGKVTVDQADCPDKICQQHRPIQKVGETIICLPHKLVVEITER